MNGVKAVVAGGGIAGLATGIALRQAGCEVQILERSPDLREIGAGLMIWPNGERALQALGVDIAAPSVRYVSMYTWRGRQLNRYPLDSIEQRYGSLPYVVYRAGLHSALAQRFGESEIRFGSEVVGFDQDDSGVNVALRGGATVHADLLVGAEGLRSPVRRRLLGDGDPDYLGSTVWRGIAPGDRFDITNEGGVNWVGRGSEFLAFQLEGGGVYWAGVTKEPAGEEPGPKGHKEDVLQRFGYWTPPVPELIAATEATSILRNDMYDRKASRRWSSDHVTLVGDAAHPMTPNAGQGACQALEDAVALGTSVGQTSSLSDALKVYEHRRLRRANRLVMMSRQATRATQIENGFLCAVRDTIGSTVAGLLYERTLDWMLAPAATSG